MPGFKLSPMSGSGTQETWVLLSPDSVTELCVLEQVTASLGLGLL